jgi:23S rRNA pseudouridine1911/1915/1917 synthase
MFAGCRDRAAVIKDGSGGGLRARFVLPIRGGTNVTVQGFARLHMATGRPDDELDHQLPEAVDAGGCASIMAGDDAKGKRLDIVLATGMASFSRSRLQALIKDGKVLVAGKVATDPGLRLRGGEELSIIVPPPDAPKPRAENIPLAVVFEDEHLIVIDKPAGLVVHPAAGHARGTLVNALIGHCGDSLSGIGGVRRPGIVHRLDKDTSGLLVVAKSDTAHTGLSEQFAAHGADGRLERAYLAVVWGVPPRNKGVIEAALSRSARNRVKIAVVPEGSGRHAVSQFAVVETFVDKDGEPVASLVRLVLETGRTHQIRVHMAHIGHPLLGDTTYGSGFQTRAARLFEEAQTALRALGRQALHAAELGFEHPVTGKGMRFRSELPGDLDRLLTALRDTPTKARRSSAGRRRRST